jgi:hypothetical protein
VLPRTPEKSENLEKTRVRNECVGVGVCASYSVLQERHHYHNCKKRGLLVETTKKCKKKI